MVGRLVCVPLFLFLPVGYLVMSYLAQAPIYAH